GRTAAEGAVTARGIEVHRCFQTNVAIEELTLAYEGLKATVNLDPSRSNGSLGGGATIHDRGRATNAGGFFSSN
ncbi:MAG: hypothetical protein AAFY11_13675, partial [Cyanobacteria bacterium J06641_5]